MKHTRPERREDAVFGVIVAGDLLYDTIKPNPARALREYKRLNRGKPEQETCLMQFRMRRARLPGDVRGIFKDAMLKKDGYIGPMR